MTPALGRLRPTRDEVLGWLAVVALVVYILVAVYDWRLPTRNGFSFGPIWAVLAAIAVLVTWRIRGRLEPV